MSRGGKLLLGFFVYSATIFVLGLAGTLWYVAHEFMKPGPLEETVTVEIPRGANVGGIADLLSYPGVIDRPILFKYTAILLRKHRNLKAGEYEFEAHISMKGAMNKIAQGTVVKRRFTIREGLTSYEIVRILREIEELSGEITAIPAEGSLLPNTYDYRRGEDRNAILTRLAEPMTRLAAPPPDGLCDTGQHTQCWPLPLTSWEDVITLASIVEKETGVAGERARIAGVFLNRLKKGIPLQTDPTVIYAITRGKHKNDGRGPLGRRLLSKDLAFDSPYNTYKYSGLPPGPIANPGRASIEAVLEPESHNFLYFVADGTGGHVFAKTLEEHNKNVAEWRKIRKQKK